MYPKLFGIEFLNTYGFCIGLGIVFCFVYLRYASKKLNIPAKFEDFVEYNGIISIVLGIVSAMLFQSFYNYLDNPELGFRFGTDMTFIGGLIGGVATFLIIYFAYGRKKYGAHLLELLPIAAGCILIAHGCGRMGCFFYGCCYGKEAQPHAFLAMNYPTALGNGHYSREWIYPTQLYEAVFLIGLFFICAYITIKKKYQNTMGIYLICYGVFRFFNEFLRDDSRGSFIPGISPSQFWSIMMVILGIVFLIVMPKIYKQINEQKMIEEQLNQDQQLEINEEAK